MNRRRLTLIGAVAFAARVAYVQLARPTVLFNSDGNTFHLLGRLIAHGDGYLAPYDYFYAHQTRPTAEFGPVHPTVLALADRLGFESIHAQQLFMCLVGSITCVLIATLAFRLFGDVHLGLVAGLLAAVDPMLLGSDGALMAETVYVLLGVALLLALHAGGRWLLAAGALLGLAVLTRGDALLLVPFVAVPVLWRRWRDIAVVGAVALLVVVPWLVRNEARFHHLVLSNNVGSLLSGSNCGEAYDGRLVGSWSYDCAYRPPLPGTDEARNSAILRRTGIDYARTHAARLASVVVPARVARGWGLLHPFGQARAEVIEARVELVQRTGVVLTWVLLAGTALALARGHRHPALLGLLAMATALLAVSYGDSRFREIAEPGLLISGLRPLTYRR